jgi:2-phospho-L-lactate guanylyltransferase
VIPVKTLLRSKTRLAEVLNLQERQSLTLAMLEDVLRAVQESFMVQQILVVSSDSKVRRFTINFGATFLPEKTNGLNQAIEQAIGWCVENDAKSVLILPADIPLITLSDVNQIINLGSEQTSIVIAPSRNGGTNALLQKPPEVISQRFGPESFSKHLAEASTKGVILHIYRSQNVTMDIDSPEDLENLLKTEAQTSTHKFLKPRKI